MIYWDMDGVLAIYDDGGYTGNKPRYRERGYYLHREPDMYAIEMFKRSLKLYPNHNKVATGVDLNDAEVRFNQTVDKMYWLHSLVPEFNVGENFLAIAQAKNRCIMELKGTSLSKSDILIDDYNPNLLNWEASGGTAIKYYNCRNNCSEDSWLGYVLVSKEVYEERDLKAVATKNWFVGIERALSTIFRG